MTTDTLQPDLIAEGMAEFLDLEAKIERVAEALRLAREERARAEAALAPLQAAYEKLQRAHGQAEQELVSLRKERNEVRQRVGRLVQQLDRAGA